MKTGTATAGMAERPDAREVQAGTELTRTEGRTARPTVGVTAPGQKFPLGRWTLFRNPFSKTAKPLAAPLGVPVQAELSLELVKPVRNDLTDSDLVVVLGRAGAMPPAAEPASDEVTAARPVWSRITSQLFGTVKG